MSWNNIIPVEALLPVDAEAVTHLKKLAARPGSKWATGNRLNQKGFTQPKGFARGARTK